MVYTYLIHIYLSDNVSYVKLRSSYVIYGAIYCILTNLRFTYIIRLGVEKGHFLRAPHAAQKHSISPPAPLAPGAPWRYVYAGVTSRVHAAAVAIWARFPVTGNLIRGRLDNLGCCGMPIGATFRVFRFPS